MPSRIFCPGHFGRFLFAAQEEAEWVAGGVEHDTDPLGITVRRLPRCFRPGRVEIIDLNFEMNHLRLLAGSLGPARRLVPRLALDVDVHTTRRVPQLGPMRWIEVTG